ncbi:alpha-N-acetylgalactosamine-specific lectin-like [Diadema antillarum]|uniref:alpha-N-acetylgalactosamine-specific lectin-like n=1 Tax=Diadema antillarum TaxID=105358 RepID=UPI003A8A46B5
MKLTIAFLVVLASYMAVGGQASVSCPRFWTGFYGSCYRLFLAKKTWQDAENHCVRLGGHLTSVLSEAENTFLYNYWRYTIPTPAWGFWIGYNDITTEGRWVWSDHSTPRAPYTNWRRGQPDDHQGRQDCCRVWYTGASSDTARDWDDGQCGARGDYICKLTF